MADERARDRTDEIVAHWCRENPTLDETTKSLAIRLDRAAHHLQRAFREDLAGLEMDTSEVEVLLALRRSPDLSAGAGQLLRSSQVTSGAITNRIARLEQRGWVRRQVDSNDRRQVIVSLTDDGLEAANRVIATKSKAEERLFAGLDRATCIRMADDLRTLLLTLEGPAPGEVDGATVLQIGLDDPWRRHH